MIGDVRLKCINVLAALAVFASAAGVYSPPVGGAGRSLSASHSDRDK